MATSVPILPNIQHAQDLEQQNFLHDQQYRDAQRQQQIAQTQRTAMNVGQVIRNGVNPDTGAQYTPQELTALAQHHRELTAHVQDLFDPNHEPNKMGPNLAAAAGVEMPASIWRRATDHLGITHQDPGGPRTPGDVISSITQSPYGDNRVIDESPLQVYKRNVIAAMGDTPEAQRMIQARAAHEAGFNLKAPVQQLRPASITTKDGKTVPVMRLQSTTPDPLTGEQPKDLVFGLDGQPIPEDQLQGATFAATTPPKTGAVKPIAFNSASGTISDPATGKVYFAADAANNPPDVQKMFDSNRAVLKQKEDALVREGYARSAAFNSNRPMVVMNPDPNAAPGSAIIVPAGVAEAKGMQSVQSGQFKTINAMLKEASSGKLGTEMSAYGTAYSHADLLRQAAKALQANDIRGLQKISNTLSTQFGDPAVTNFQAIANAYGREVSKALTAGHMTDSEIASVGATLPANASPDQISGVLDAYSNLMVAKMHQREYQINAGLQGSAYVPAIPGQAPGGPGTSSGRPPQSAAPAGTQAFTDGGKTYHIPKALVAAFKRDHPNAR